MKSILGRLKKNVDGQLVVFVQTFVAVCPAPQIRGGNERELGISSQQLFDLTRDKTRLFNKNEQRFFCFAWRLQMN